MNDKRRIFISGVVPLDHYVLQVDFISGSRVLLDMSEHIECVRFNPLKNLDLWKKATTNGLFVRFGDVELSHDEILAMLEIPRCKNKNSHIDYEC